MDLPPLETDLYDRLRDDIRLRGIQVPILVDGKTGEVVDGRMRQAIAKELKIRDVPTIYVGRLTEDERDDLRVAVNLYRRHLNRAQMRELIAWALRQQPEASDRRIARKTGTNHRTVAGVRRGLEGNGEILHYETRTTANGKQYPAAKPTVHASSAAEGRRARTLLDRLGDDAPPRPATIQNLQTLAFRKAREALKYAPESRLPAGIRVECCDFRDLDVPDDSVDLIFTDPPWGQEGRKQMKVFSGWAARKLKPDGGVLLIYTGHGGLFEIGNQLARKLDYLWTLSCFNGHAFGTATMRRDLQIRCCWRPLLMFCRGRYKPLRSFDDAVISEDRDKTYHDYQQPLSEAIFYVDVLTRAKAVVCDPFLGSGTTAVAVARLGQGRRFVGSEIDPDTCKVARNRVAEELESGGTGEPQAGGRIPGKATASAKG